MSKREPIEGILEPSVQGHWRIGSFILMSGTFMELFIGGTWVIGCLDFCETKVCQFVCWDEGLRIILRQGLKVRAIHFNHG